MGVQARRLAIQDLDGDNVRCLARNCLALRLAWTFKTPRQVR